MSFVSYAQNFEDVMLWRALKHIEHGFYVDVGAQHPVIDSVSKAFYEHGWRGMHIEPVPEYADLLREDRPDETVLQLALSDNAGTLELNVLPDTGLSTFNDDYARRHQQEHGFSIRRITVPTLTLTEALQEQARKEIHWLKIDVEGHEARVLKGWDSKHIRPWIIVVEATVPLSKIEDYQTWEQYLTKSRYNFAYFDGINRFYVAAEHRELAEHFKSPPNVLDGFVLNGTGSWLCHTVVAERDDNAKRAAAAGEQVNALEAKSQRLQDECDTAQQRVAELSDQAGALESELATQRGQTAQHEHDLTAAREQVTTLEAKTQWLQNERDTAQQGVAELSHRTGALETGLATQRAQTAQREDELTAAREQVSTLEAKTRLLQDERDTAQQRVAELSHRTGALETGLATQRGQTAQREHELAAAREQVSTLEAKTQRLQVEWDAAKSRGGELDRASHEWWTVADGLTRELHSVYASKSWRITLPLRKSAVVAKWVLALPPRVVRWVLRLPKRMAKPLMVGIVRRSLADPGLKARAKNALAKYPKLKQHLRQFAVRSGLLVGGGDQASAPSYGSDNNSNSVSVVATGNNQPISEEPIQDLSPRAAKIYADIKKAIEARGT